MDGPARACDDGGRRTMQYAKVIALLTLALFVGVAAAGCFGGTPPPRTKPNQEPTVTFLAAVDTLATQPMTLGVNATDPDGTIRYLVWDFGDKSPEANLTNNTTTHIYAKPGPYTVRVTA